MIYIAALTEASVHIIAGFVFLSSQLHIYKELDTSIALSKVLACFHFSFIHIHLGQQAELPTDPLLLLILTSKRPWIPPQ